ncbi:hypothetical protein C8R44DRAFT_869002 [Mycena epipterygia]|nr:hypothetical protein C8R44DRAFT_869002 [Mycena epipterygia]
MPARSLERWAGPGAWTGERTTSFAVPRILLLRRHALPFSPLGTALPALGPPVSAPDTSVPALPLPLTNTAANATAPALPPLTTVNANVTRNAPAPTSYVSNTTNASHVPNTPNVPNANPRNPARKSTRRPTRRATREMRELMQLLEARPNSPVQSPTRPHDPPLVPTRPNSPVPDEDTRRTRRATHDFAHLPPLETTLEHTHEHGSASNAHTPDQDSDARPPLVTTRRIYEAARTSPRRVRAWRTEVDRLEVDVEVEAGGEGEEGVFEGSGEEGAGWEFGVVRGTGAGEENAQEEGEDKGVQRASTSGEASKGGRGGKEMKETKKGKKEKQEQKRASLPLLPRRLSSMMDGLGSMRTGTGLASMMRADTQTQLDYEYDTYSPRGKNGKGKQRRTTVTRSRAVSVAVAVGEGKENVVGAGAGAGAGTGTSARPALKIVVPLTANTPASTLDVFFASNAMDVLSLTPGAENGAASNNRTPGSARPRPVSWLAEEGEEEEGRACESPEPVWPCQGNRCREAGHGHEKEGEEADVISFASCKDYQVSWEDGSGGSMTRELVRILERDPHPTLRALVTGVSHALHRMSLKRHLEVRQYKRDLKTYNAYMAAGGRGPPTQAASASASATVSVSGGAPTMETSRASTLEPATGPATPAGTPPASIRGAFNPGRVRGGLDPGQGQKHRTGTGAELKTAQMKAKARSEGASGLYDMESFQNPEVASHRPLDMERPWSM